MKKKVIKKNSGKRSLLRQISEAKFWQKTALRQQILLHAKNNT